MTPRTSGRNKEKDPTKLAELKQQLAGLRKRLDELRSAVPQESSTHGWVWLYLQRPSEKRSSPPK